MNDKSLECLKFGVPEVITEALLTLSTLGTRSTLGTYLWHKILIPIIGTKM